MKKNCFTMVVFKETLVLCFILQDLINIYLVFGLSGIHPYEIILLITKRRWNITILKRNLQIWSVANANMSKY